MLLHTISPEMFFELQKNMRVLCLQNIALSDKLLKT